jgi:hypothetical protein
LSKNPFTAPELVKSTLWLYAGKGLDRLVGREGVERRKRIEARLEAIGEIAYDENAHRRLIGRGVAVALLFLSLWAVVVFWT